MLCKAARYSNNKINYKIMRGWFASAGRPFILVAIVGANITKK